MSLLARSMKRGPMFNAKNFLVEAFQTPTALVAFLRAYGVSPPQLDAVKKWFQRGTIPGEWLPVLLAVLELDSGHPISVQKHLE